jgi:hypothetical protein
MAIIEDYAEIAAELRRIRNEKPPEREPGVSPRDTGWHRMRSTTAGDRLYRRLISPRYRYRSDLRENPGAL